MDAIETALNELQQLSIVELRHRFLEVMGYTSTSRSRSFLTRKILWGVQAAEQGDISADLRQQAIEAADERVLRHRISKNSIAEARVVGSIQQADNRIPPPGTLLTRRYRNQEVCVKVLSDGFEWRAQKFTSLSAIAREVTGTRWNGFAFFKLEGGK